MLIKLSHTLANDLPFYKGRTIEMVRKVRENGNFLRETLLPIDSHTGTHLDFGAHVHKDGVFGDHLKIDFFHFDKIAIVETDDININQESLFSNINKDVEIILIKSGMCHKRKESEYWEKSPIIAAKLASFFQNNFPSLRVIGLDFISITSQLNVEEGRLAHESLLGQFVVIEDMDLTEINRDSNILELTIAPIFFKDMDGSPCTIFAKI